MANPAKVRTASGTWVDLAVQSPDISNYSTTTQMNTAISAGNGLKLITKLDFTTAVSQIAFNNVFSSNYDMYKIFFQYVVDTGNSQRYNYLRLRASGIDDSANNYLNIGSAYENTSFRGGGVNATQGGFNINSLYYADSYAWGEINILFPFNVRRTYTTVIAHGGEAATDTTQTSSGMHVTSASYDGFSFNFTNMKNGSIYIYGVKNS